MSTSYIPYLPDQQYLMPCALQDWVPEGHLAYFINDTVDSLDLKAFHTRYAGGGSRNQPFHPAMTVKVLVYAYVFQRKLRGPAHHGLWKRWRSN
jgi:transposase